MIRPVFILLFLFTAHSVFSQNDFSAGTIVLNKGDSLSVLIKKMNGRIAPRVVEYKTTGSSEVKSLSASEVKWFRYSNGEWYFSYAGPLESSSLNTQDLSYDSLMNTVIDTLFVRAVIISRASLYYARDRYDRIHLFIQKGTSAIVELGYKKYYIDEVVLADYQSSITKRTVMANEMYKGQLVHAFADCPFIAAGITSRMLAYAKNDLLGLFEEYNRCKRAKIIYKEGKDAGKVEFVLLGGINSTGVALSSTWEPWTTIHFSRSFGLEAGIGCNYLLPRLQNKFSIYNELLIKAHSLHGTAGTNETISLKSTYGKLVTTGRYQVQKNIYRIFIEAGMTNSLAIAYKNSASGDVGSSMIRDYRSYEQGAIFGTGMQWKRICSELRLERSNGFSEYSALKTAVTTWYLQFGYVF